MEKRLGLRSCSSGCTCMCCPGHVAMHARL
jgi:hypothetical protein